jgi:NTE family protein
MSEWRDSLIRWRCGLSLADRRKYGAPDGWNCRDLKFFVGRINFDQLGKQRANELSAVPTRFRLAPETVETVVTAGRDALRANTTFQAFLSTL